MYDGRKTFGKPKGNPRETLGEPLESPQSLEIHMKLQEKPQGNNLNFNSIFQLFEMVITRDLNCNNLSSGR